jgi:hypothetical protein
MIQSIAILFGIKPMVYFLIAAPKPAEKAHFYGKSDAHPRLVFFIYPDWCSVRLMISS